MDDRTSGLVIRALRHRRGWRQADLAARAGVSQSTISRAERGWLEDLTLRVIRAIFAALEARVQLAPRWKGAELERLLDEDHSAVVAEVTQRLESLGWAVQIEVTYSEYGERGSIDVLGTRAAERAIVVVEVKTDIASSEAVGRKLDEKARLAPGIVRERLGWSPVSVGRLVVLPESMRLRRVVGRHPVLARMFPIDAAAIRRWLRRPTGTLAGLWYLSITTHLTTREARRTPSRRIRSRPGVGHAREGSGAGASPPEWAAPAPESAAPLHGQSGGG